MFGAFGEIKKPKKKKSVKYVCLAGLHGMLLVAPKIYQ